MEEQSRSVDICILCALYEEASAVMDEFSTRCGVTFTKTYHGLDRYEYQSTTIKNTIGESLIVLVTWLSEMGPIAVAQELKVLLQQFHPRFVAMTGICAGDQRKVQLGDLIIASAAYHYEEGKVIRGPDGQSHHLSAIRAAGPADQMLQYIRGFEGWKKPVTKMKRQFLKRSLQEADHPKQIIAPMASGMAVHADNPFSWLQERYHRNTVALDMEAASFYQVLRTFPHTLVVKGVCDYADMTKNDVYHDYAARASAIYLLYFIREYVTEETVPRRDAPLSEKSSSIWNVPYPRNPHFTGRDELLNRLHQHLSPEAQNDSTTCRAALTQPQAIKGLGGIGKTQIAVEYVYRSREQGHYTHTLWINAASEEALITSFVTIADLLPAFPAKSETDQRKLVAAVKRWLEQCQQRWLLIFDNADDIALVHEYFPQGGNGSILLTTRANAVASIGASLEVETMSFMEGTQLLLRRTQRFEHTSDEEINEAANVVVALDHFPLALDQAGAYIEETNCRFGDYLSIYQNHRRALLARRGMQITNYPDSVATTWSLSFGKVEQANPAAAELLRLCAFLAPDRIPEELIKDSAAHWSSLLQQATANLFTFNQMIAELLKFSLVKRLAEDNMLSIHRLVQAVQVDNMELDEQCHWAERVVCAVNAVFPRNSKEEIAAWPQCLRYLEQVQMCDTLIQQHLFVFPEAADLLYRTGVYLYEHASYTIAEPLYQRALCIWEQQLGPEHPQVAYPLNNLAHLCSDQGKYAEAELLYQRALRICEQHLGSEHLQIATSLDGLAFLSHDQSKYAEAELLYQRALRIREQQLGPEHPDVAASLNGLARLYHEQGKYAEVEPLYRRALHICEQQLGPEHPDVARPLNNLAYLYHEQGKYAEAEPLYRRALRICEQQLGPEHPLMAYLLNNLANLYRDQGKYAEAEPLYRRALHIREQQLGAEHPDVAHPLDNLANLYREQGKYAEAEPLYLRALRICEQQFGPEHPQVAVSLHGLALLYHNQGKYTEAEPLYLRTLRIREQQFGPEHPDVARRLTGLANLYRDQGKYAEAEPLYRRALRIWERQFGPEHPRVAHPLHGLAYLYHEQGKYAEAELLYQRALRIREQQLGPEHPDVASLVQGLALLYSEQGKYAEAEPLYRRALRIWERQFGSKHPNVASSLHGLANLYRDQGKYAEAEPLYHHALQIREQALGSQHPETAEVMHGLAQLREAQSYSEEAKAWYTRARTVREQALGVHHRKTLETCKYLIALLHAMGQHEEAAQVEQETGNSDE